MAAADAMRETRRQPVLRTRRRRHAPCGVLHGSVRPVWSRGGGTVVTLVIMVCLLLAGECAAVGSGRNVLLHAQASYETSKMVVGSLSTTAGMSEALRARGDINTTMIVSPYEYDETAATRWDLLIIEGYFFQAPTLIHELRAANPHIIVLYFCLDPILPGFSDLAHLDVDGVLTNSQRVIEERVLPHPTWFVPLAATPFPPQFYRKYEHPVVFVGGRPPILKGHLFQMLREAVPFGLVIYGAGWAADPEFASVWRGILPPGDLHALYSSAKVALGATMQPQAEWGMVNNRVFEVLAAGCVMISDHFPELEALFGDRVLYWKQEGDVSRHLATILGPTASHSAQQRAAASVARRHWIEQHHTWDVRMASMLAFVDQLVAARAAASENIRAAAPKVAVLHDPACCGPDSPLLGLSFWPAVARLKWQYRVVPVTVREFEVFMRVAASCPITNVTHCRPWHALWVVDSPTGAIVQRVALAQQRSLLCPCTRLALVAIGSDETECDIATPAQVPTWDSVYTRLPGAVGCGFESIVRHRNMVYAIGVDSHLSCATMQAECGFHDNQVAASNRLLYVGAVNSQSRAAWAARVGGVPRNATLVATHGPVEPWFQQFMQHKHAVVVSATSVCDLMREMCRVTDVYLPSRHGDASIIPALVADRLGRAVHVERDSLLLTGTWNASLEQYSQRLMFGMSRMLAVGRGASSVRWIAPVNGSHVPAGVVTRVEWATIAFQHGEDGRVCVNASVIDATSQALKPVNQTCVLVPLIQPYLKIQCTVPTWVHVQLTLVSNMYMDVIAASATNMYFVDQCEVDPDVSRNAERALSRFDVVVHLDLM